MSTSQPPPAPRPRAPLEQASDAAELIRQRFTSKPRVGLILGTGLGGLAESIADPTSIPYSDIPHFPRATVAGHAGRLVLGRLGDVVVAALQGRFHLYEGYTPAQIVLPTRTLGQLGIEILIVTNAAGGLAPGQQAGDLLLISEHIGLPTMAGQNPLMGPNDEQLGPRFPAMTDAYDASLRAEALRVAEENGFALHEGVYAMVSGPSFESPAELRFLRTIGADAVGMSTVPEVIAARHMGLRTLAISCITNVALPSGDGPVPEPSHAEVLRVADQAGERLATVIQGVLEHIAAVTGGGP
ncbi:MAG: purine-nucleoside phosphorylase [Chloroflexi bacterium]|nr:MAG: purine-nucleoside phosphorylase [Chloroflexota bacterium]